MKYMGSKRRIAKDILPIILQDRKPGQYYVEPFVGGANMVENVEGPCIGADLNGRLIKALNLIKYAPESLPDHISEEDYETSRMFMSNDGLTGYIGFTMSFGSKWFGGYARARKGAKHCPINEATMSRRAKESALVQSPKIKHVDFVHSGYQELTLPKNSIVYCDPPYEGTTKYKTGGFDHTVFWNWCRQKNLEGHTVFVSEYNAPPDFLCVCGVRA